MKKFVIISIILISLLSCNSNKNENNEIIDDTEITSNVNNMTETLETNILNTYEIYEGYAANEDIDDILQMAGEENLKALEDFHLVKDAYSLDEWQLKHKDKVPLIFAINYCPTEEKAIKLIEYGTAVNQKDFNGLTPLMSASLKGYVKLAIELIKHNADVNARVLDSRGNISADSLFYAVNANNKNSLELVKVLLNFGANPNIVYSDPEEGDFTILDRSLYYNNFEIFKTLVENGANISKVNDRGEPFIVDAIRRERFDIVEYLVDKGIDPTMKYTDYRNIPFSLLVATVNNRNTEIAEYLIEKGADVNSKDTINSSSEEAVNLIFTAIENGNTALVKLLIENGADTSVFNKDRKTIFNIAREKGYNDILELEK